MPCKLSSVPASLLILGEGASSAASRSARGRAGPFAGRGRKARDRAKGTSVKTQKSEKTVSALKESHISAARAGVESVLGAHHVEREPSGKGPKSAAPLPFATSTRKESPWAPRGAVRCFVSNIMPRRRTGPRLRSVQLAKSPARDVSRTRETGSRREVTTPRRSARRDRPSSAARARAAPRPGRSGRSAPPP